MLEAKHKVPPIPSPSKVPQQVMPSQQESTSAEGEVIQFDSHLDDILNKAKAIREREPNSGRKAKKPSERNASTTTDSSKADKKAKNTPRSLASLLDSKAVNRNYSGNSKPSVTNTRDPSLPLPPSTNQGNFEGVEQHVQLTPQLKAADELLAMQLTSPLESLLPSQALLLNLAHFMSQLQSGPLFPPSAVLEVVMQHYQFMFQSHNVLEGLSPDQCSRYLRRARKQFDKMLKLKLNRLSSKDIVSSLSDNEVCDICALWWNVHRCNLVYEMSTVTSPDDIDTEPFLAYDSKEDEYNDNYGFDIPDDQRKIELLKSPLDEQSGRIGLSPLHEDWIRLRSLVIDLVGKIPIYTTPPHLSLAVAHHDQVQTRVSYAVETILSKLLLPTVLQAMKECVAETSTALSGSGRSGNSAASERKSAVLKSDAQSLDSRWVAALQLFQAAYQMLALADDDGTRSSAPQHSRRKHNVLLFKKDIRTI